MGNPTGDWREEEREGGVKLSYFPGSLKMGRLASAMSLYGRSGFSQGGLLYISLSFRIQVTTSSPHPFRPTHGNKYASGPQPGPVFPHKGHLATSRHFRLSGLENATGLESHWPENRYLGCSGPSPPGDAARHGLRLDHTAALHGLQRPEELASPFRLQKHCNR